MDNKSVYKNQEGFTLLEMLVAIIIFVLASLFIVSLTANAIDRPKEAGIKSDFDSYYRVGNLLLKETNGSLTEEDLVMEFNNSLNRDLEFKSGVSEGLNPYNEPYKLAVTKDSMQTSIIITTTGKSDKDIYKIAMIIEGVTVEHCTRGFGKNDKNLKSLESEHCLNSSESEVEPTEPTTPPEPEEPSFIPVTEVPAGCTGIYTALDMYNIRNNLTGCFIVMNPIDLSVYPNWLPIGGENSATRFKGTLDGQMYPITNLKINRTAPNGEDNGLFGRVEGATFKNVFIDSPTITANSNTGALFGEGNLVTVLDSKLSGGVITGVNSLTTGGLVGKVKNGTISNSFSNTTITGNMIVGGLAGSLENSLITDSCVNGSVKTTSAEKTGGLVGDGYYLTVENSYSDATIEVMQGDVGGIVGYTLYGTVKNSSNRGTISGFGYSVGGVVGQGERNLLVDASYSTGSITGSTYVGGLVGHVYLEGTVTNSYTAGEVWGYNKVGGLVGETNYKATIRNSYSSSKVTGSSTVGGLVGNLHTGSIYDSYSTGDITVFLGSGGMAHAVGGLVGDAGGDDGGYVLERSYSTSSITGETNANVGGFAGVLDRIKVTDVYSTGNINTTFVDTTGYGYTYPIGGFAGSTIYANIGHAYSTGKVKGPGVPKGHIGDEKYSTVSGTSFYDRQTSGKTGDGTALKAKTTLLMKQKATYVGWDFDTVWQIEEGVSYPTLR